MKMGAHISPLARQYIIDADILFMAVSSGVFALWLKELNPNCVDLQTFYGAEKNRKRTYQEMIEAILIEVREGKNVCAAFYGHPGVFAWAPHEAINIAREEGYDAHMEPGISAEDCLYSDLGIDPGKFGCQHFEATQFLKYKRIVDPSAYLILWQIGLTGESNLGLEYTNKSKLEVLTKKLSKIYSLEHEVIIYESGHLVLEGFKRKTVTLDCLPETSTNLHSTLIIPPYRRLELE
ncbi:MAG: hypothetical protein HUJ16_12710 [Kangiella sp.]|nr:hypothetical protein [Kangiella sp.]